MKGVPGSTCSTPTTLRRRRSSVDLEGREVAEGTPRDAGPGFRTGHRALHLRATADLERGPRVLEVRVLAGDERGGERTGDQALQRVHAAVGLGDAAAEPDVV